METVVLAGAALEHLLRRKVLVFGLKASLRTNNPIVMKDTFYEGLENKVKSHYVQALKDRVFFVCREMDLLKCSALSDRKHLINAVSFK